MKQKLFGTLCFGAFGLCALAGCGSDEGNGVEVVASDVVDVNSDNIVLSSESVVLAESSADVILSSASVDVGEISSPSAEGSDEQSKVSSNSKSKSSSSTKSTNSSSSKAKSSSSAKTTSSSSAKVASSSSAEPDSPFSVNSTYPIPYETVCPAGKTCTYVTTAYLTSYKNVHYGEFLDTRDYKVYKTIEINNVAGYAFNGAVWLAQNLDYAATKSFCYDNNQDSCAKYGRLYPWSVAMDSAATFSKGGAGCGYGLTCKKSGIVRGVCPEGWHVSTYSEWKKLSDALYSTTAGYNLKSEKLWEEHPHTDGKGNYYGFSAIPAGVRNAAQQSVGIGTDAYIWTSREYDEERAYHAYLYYAWADLFIPEGPKNSAMSVRCVKNNGTSADVIESSSSVVASSSSEEVFGTLLDIRDGHTYRTVKIGSQVWMAQNLSFKYGESTKTKSYCYDDEDSSCDTTFGRLYTWGAAMDSSGRFGKAGKGCGYKANCDGITHVTSLTPDTYVRGVCPEKWHLPSVGEWEALINEVGGATTAATKLKAATLWSSGASETDPYGFSAYPAGIRNEDEIYDMRGSLASFWTSSSNYSNTEAVYMHFDDSESVATKAQSSAIAASVRCVKD